jgi:peptide-methionine (S)-S-oxide reductase
MVRGNLTTICRGLSIPGEQKEENAMTKKAKATTHVAGSAAIAALTLLGLPVVLPQVHVVAAEEAFVIPPPEGDAPLAASASLETAVLAGGCFWGVQAVFQHTNGVTEAVSGYAGGSGETANYQIVGSGRTGHAEAVEVTYDPSRISYGEILHIYFSVAHDPTQIDRQGPDVGSQYRSEIFTANDEQVTIASAYIAQLDAAGVYDRPIATKVSALDAFYPAEDYHQDYATLHPDSAYIARFDLPKIANLQRLFPEAYRAEPELVGVSANPG